jgi:RND family efflux transporter MFP subunit
VRAALLSRVFVTAVVVAAAVAAGWLLCRNYMEGPGTRDGRVRADLVTVAPDVSGMVLSVRVRDNQAVAKGEILFLIDPERYRLVVAEAEAAVQGRASEREQRQREVERRRRLGSAAISEESREQSVTALASAEAAYRQAVAELATAWLNLAQTEVRAPVNGFVTNLRVDEGDYAVT